MFDNLTNHGLLDKMCLDLAKFELKFNDYPNKGYLTKERVWQRWISFV